MKKRDLSHLKSKDITVLEKKGNQICKYASREGAVLLENNGALPLSPQKIALFGYGARHTVLRGIGSGDVSMRYYISVEEGLKNAGFEILTEQWLDSFDKQYRDYHKKLIAGLHKEAEETGIDCIHILYEKPHALLECPPIDERDVAGLHTDTAVYVLSRKEGEGRDNRYVEGEYLPSAAETEHLRRLRKRFSKLIVLLNVASVIDMREILDIGPDAVLLIFQGGAEIGTAVAELLTGQVSPSGKLTDTWAQSYWDYASSDCFGENCEDENDVLYREGIYVGYRYFDTFDIQPLYPFGYGLSYTSFRQTVKTISMKNGIVTAEIKVKNTGRYSGKEVVQMYLSSPGEEIEMPYQQLCAYEKTDLLLPGEEQDVKLAFDLRDFACYDVESSEYCLFSGKYIVRYGDHSRNTEICCVVQLNGKCVIQKLKRLFECPVMFQEIHPESGNIYQNPRDTYERKKAPLLYVDPREIEPLESPEYSTDPVNYISGSIDTSTVNLGTGQKIFVEVPEQISLADVKNGIYTMEQLVASLKEEELFHLLIGQEYVNPNYLLHHVSTHVVGAVGETTNYLAKSGKQIPYTVMADGPAGLRLITRFQTDPDGNLVMVDPVLNYENGIYGLDEYHDREEGYTDYYQYVTALPIQIQLACTWNKKLLEDVGDIVGAEMERYDIDLWLAPGMNIHRNPLCGRNFEYFSEDPTVSAQSASALIRGVQRHKGKGATIKHMAANNQETLRTKHNSIVSERVMREIYLKGFRIAIREAAPAAVMTSLNCINGKHGANNPDVARYVVRDEWGYDGLILTDWNTTTPERGASTVGCVHAANDLIMPGTERDVEKMSRALHNMGEDGDKVTLGELQRSARNILRYIMNTQRV